METTYNRKNNTRKLKIEQIIAGRLNLQTNKRILNDKFDIPVANLNYITNPLFLNRYSNWDEGKKIEFISTIGGATNFNTTRFFIESKLKIHKLVVTHFIDSNLPDRYEICHRDSNINNNSVSNLYIGNRITNILDRYRQGRTKLTPDEIALIRSSKLPQKELAFKYKVAQSYISRIKNYTRATVPFDKINYVPQ